MLRLKVNRLKRLINIVIMTLGIGSIAHVAYAQSVSSAELINSAKIHDGKVVDYQGEVIGDVMMRGQHAWINVNDGGNAIGIWASETLVKDIAYKGSYAFKGDEVRITGTFNRSCLEHGGDLDIHARSIRKIASGGQTPESLDFNKIKIALTLLGTAILLSLLDYLARKRYPKHII